MAPAGSLVDATRPSGSPRLSSRCPNRRSANAPGRPRTANLTPVERRDFGPGRTLVAESTWDWMLLREAGGALVLSVADNLQRKRVHRLPAPLVARRLRLVATATHGVASARVFEIRAYGA